MTFTYRLARSLARLRAVAWVLCCSIIFACQQGGLKEGLGPPDPPPAAPPPPPPPVQDRPNEPAGYTRFFQVDFTSPIGGIFNCNGTEQDGAAYGTGSAGTQILTDPTTPPISDKSVTRYTYSQGHTPGNSPANMVGWDTCSENNSTSYDEVYETFYIKLDAPNNVWVSHQALTKAFGYFGVGGKGNGETPTQAYLRITGGTASEFAIGLTVQYDPGSGPLPTFNRGQNVNGGWRMQVGHWYQFEKVVTINSGLNTQDGTLKVWMRRHDESTPTLIMDYSDLWWKWSGAPSGFYGRFFNPVWGGTGGPTLSQTQYIYVDQWYMSGKP